MKTSFYYGIPLLASVLFFQSCESDKDPEGQKYESGLLIVNEGGFGAGNGTVTYVDGKSGEVMQNIFKNTEGFAGDVLQSITLTDDRAYLVLNGDNKIEIADESTFSGEATLTAPAIDKPRYIEVIDGKAFISVWGPYDENFSLVDSYVLVVNASNLQPVDTIDTDEGVENLLYNGTYLFASNYNFGSSNTLAIIDPDDNELVDQIQLSAGPAGMVLDKNGKLWVITTGTYQGNDGKLFRVNPTTFAVEDDIDLGVNPGTDLEISPDKSSIIYRAGKNIYSLAIDAEAAPEEPWITVTDAVAPYALGVDPETGEVYFGDAVDYASPGVVYVYSNTGTFKTALTSGICPTQFVFRK
jgi:hypothetical protein